MDTASLYNIKPNYVRIVIGIHINSGLQFDKRLVASKNTILQVPQQASQGRTAQNQECPQVGHPAADIRLRGTATC